MIALLHLSDIHIRATDNPVTSRIDALAAAIRAEAPPLEACFILISGDIAFSGLAVEYSIAYAFLSSLKTRLISDHPTASIEYLLVPGNHDCNFAPPTDLRNLAIANLPTGDALDLSGDIVGNCLSVQDQFFHFCQQLTGASYSRSERLYQTRRYEINRHKIDFHLYNSAWLSRLPEEPGTLFFPLLAAQPSESSPSPADVTVAMLHHPLNWFVPVNARHLRTHLDRTCDVLLTGHEHVATRLKRTNDVGAEVFQLEGAVLQDSDSKASTGFNIIWLDIPGRRQMNVTYSWIGTLYKEAKKPTWIPFARNPLLAQQAFDNNDRWSELLDDPGIAFTHPRSSKLRLSDLFVYPDLTRRSVDSVVAKKDRRVLGNEVAALVSSRQRVIFTGPGDSGKTSLAKRLYMALKQREGTVPILVKGQRLHKVRNNDFSSVFVDVFEEQYSPSGGTPACNSIPHESHLGSA